MYLLQYKVGSGSNSNSTNRAPHDGDAAHTKEAEGEKMVVLFLLFHCAQIFLMVMNTLVLKYDVSKMNGDAG